MGFLPSISSTKVYDAKMSTRTRLHMLRYISSKLALKPERLKKFRRTVFGPWLDIRTEEHDNHLINFLLQNQKVVDDVSTSKAFIFDIGPHTIEFGRREFCLVTGFLFGNCSLTHLKDKKSAFAKRVFPEMKYVHGTDLDNLLSDYKLFNNLDDEDAVRVCLVYALNIVFMGFEKRHRVAKEILSLVDHLSEWDKFPWGEYMWLELYEKVYNNDAKYRKDHLKKMSTIGPTYLPTYTLPGFVFAFKIWLLELFPTSRNWWIAQTNVIPRAVAWSDRITFLKTDYDRLFQVGNRLGTLTPTSDEMKQKWWRSSIDYFHNVANKSSDRPSKKRKRVVKGKALASSTHEQTDDDCLVNITIDVEKDEGLNVPTVVEDIVDGLSVPELVKKLCDMHRDFESRVTGVMQFIQRHKMLQIAFGSHVTNSTVFNPNDYITLTENPQNRVALTKKIMDIEDEFRRRLSSIEQYLKMPKTLNLEMASCGSDVKDGNKESVFVESIDNACCGSESKAGNKDDMFGHTSFKTSCGPDVKDGNSESVFVESPVNASCREDIQSRKEQSIDSIIDCIDFGNEFDEATKETHASSKDSVCQLQVAENVAVNVLLNIKTFDTPVTSPIVHQTSVEGSKTVELMPNDFPSPKLIGVAEGDDAKDHRISETPVEGSKISDLPNPEDMVFSDVDVAKVNVSALNEMQSVEINHAKSPIVHQISVEGSKTVELMPNDFPSPKLIGVAEGDDARDHRISETPVEGTKISDLQNPEDMVFSDVDVAKVNVSALNEMQSVEINHAKSPIVHQTSVEGSKTVELMPNDFPSPKLIGVAEGDDAKDHRISETPVEGSKISDLPNPEDMEEPMAVAEPDNVKGGRKVSKFRRSPYGIQPESTPQKLKGRARKKKFKKKNDIVIPMWKEDLSRAKYAPKTQTIVPLDVLEMLQEFRSNKYYFPWSNESIVHFDFWEKLLGIGNERRGWLSSTHLDLWVLYLWNCRPAIADWALCGPYFSTSIRGKEPPCCYSDGLTYGVPWYADSVEKVYFPINAEDNHWVLAEFHIRDGVITFYDSILPQNTNVEKRDWWVKCRKDFQRNFKKVLIESEVMEKKKIDPTTYSISFRFALDAPQQAKNSGDCGIWVMRNMFILINNLPLEVKNTTQAGLAYREKLTDFFWKYKIPYKGKLCLN